MSCPCCASDFATRYTGDCPDCGASNARQRICQAYLAVIETRRAIDAEGGVVRSMRARNSSGKPYREATVREEGEV